MPGLGDTAGAQEAAGCRRLNHLVGIDLIFGFL
jgi:hypothetical protein